MIKINKANQRKEFGNGNFKVKATFPGINMDPIRDKGWINLGRIDHATLLPGAFIPMHIHQNDEILSLIKQGTMLHKDSDGNVVPIMPTFLMMMNAGSGFYHEESIPPDLYDTSVEMLQIFIRPENPNEKPMVQFANINVGALNIWRLIGGPIGLGASLNIRNRIVVYDITSVGNMIFLPESPFENWSCVLYVFSGEAYSPETGLLEKGDSVLIQDVDNFSFYSEIEVVIVAFIIDNEAKFTRAGKSSG
ncbi:MAG: pirin family protein [Bacteroidota bacterium]